MAGRRVGGGNCRRAKGSAVRAQANCRLAEPPDLARRVNQQRGDRRGGTDGGHGLLFCPTPASAVAWASCPLEWRSIAGARLDPELFRTIPASVEREETTRTAGVGKRERVQGGFGWTRATGGVEAVLEAARTVRPVPTQRAGRPSQSGHGISRARWRFAGTWVWWGLKETTSP